jgi:hypothetical protein
MVIVTAFLHYLSGYDCINDFSSGVNRAKTDLFNYLYIRYIKPGTNLRTDARMHMASSNGRSSNGSQGDSKLELFGFDSLVNILGLKRMVGEQAQASASTRDGENAGIAIGHPKVVFRLTLQVQFLILIIILFMHSLFTSHIVMHCMTLIPV